jgi:hypothetical protein
LVLGIDCKKEGTERGEGAETKREKRGVSTDITDCYSTSNWRKKTSGEIKRKIFLKVPF